MSISQNRTKSLAVDSAIAVVGLFLILLGAWVGSGINPISAIPGALIIFVGVFMILLYKTLLPKSKFPTFAMALLVGVIFSIPANPLSGYILKHTENIVFLSTTTPILAFAGLSMGNKLVQLKTLGWKLIIVALIVFTSTYLLSAGIAQIYFKMTGAI